MENSPLYVVFHPQSGLFFPLQEVKPLWFLRIRHEWLICGVIDFLKLKNFK